MYLVWVNQDLCKGCHICVGFCPRGALKPAERINQRGFLPPLAGKGERCTGCLLCEIMCPDFAIAIEKVEEADPAGLPEESR